MAGADVRGGRAARPRLVPGAATATYREMVASGITAVGEFHYLHHQADGTPYDDPNAMGRALQQAARDAGLRIRLLDTATSAAASASLRVGVQERFSDGTADALGRTGRRPEQRRRRHPLRPRRPRRPAPHDRGGQRGQAPPRAPVGADRGERRLRRGVRRHPHPAARRPRRARPADQRRARDPPDRRRHRPPRRHPYLRLLLPHHRARPRRRHRPEPRASTTRAAR